jgi:hypothetical protein
MDIVTELGIPVLILYLAVVYASRSGVNFLVLRTSLDLIERVLRLFILLQFSTLLSTGIEYLQAYNARVTSESHSPLTDALLNWTFN